MTKQQATAEMKYRLSIYILLDRYDPFTRCLEEADVWQTEL